MALARAMVCRGYEVHVAASQSSDKARRLIESAGLTFHPIQLDRSGLGPFGEIQTAVALIKLYREIRPQIVHHVTIKPVLYGGILARFARVPRIVAAIPGLGFSFGRPGLRGSLSRRMLLLLYRLAFGTPVCRVIFQNVEHRNMFVYAGILEGSRALVIRGAGVDTNEFRPSPEPSGPVKVVLAARMLREKGVEEFRLAAAALKGQGSNAIFSLVGDVDEHNPGSLDRATLQSWHDSGVIEWRGFSDRMADVLANCHIVCLPSYAEGLPKVLLEAAAAGRPIVTTDIPGCRDIGRHGENAYVVPVKDSAALAAALERLIADRELRRRFGMKGRELVEREFSIETVISQTAALYDRMFAEI